jgi:hypothetical protein
LDLGFLSDQKSTWTGAYTMFKFVSCSDFGDI